MTDSQYEAENTYRISWETGEGEQTVTVDGDELREDHTTSVSPRLEVVKVRGSESEMVFRLVGYTYVVEVLDDEDWTIERE